MVKLSKKQVVVAVDPSGNFEEGKGTTGIALFVDGDLKETSIIEASKYECAEEYWQAHIHKIDSMIARNIAMLQVFGSDLYMVCESYKLQRNKAIQQSGSWLETPQLIGYLRVRYHNRGTPLTFQDPTIKTRFNDSVLENMEVIEKKSRSYFRNGEPITMHERDAIRHGMYFIRYGKK